MINMTQWVQAGMNIKPALTSAKYSAGFQAEVEFSICPVMATPEWCIAPCYVEIYLSCLDLAK